MEEAVEKKSSLTTQSAWLLIAKIIGFALSFLLPFLVVRILDKASFGVYRQVFIVIVNATGLLSFGVGLTAYYFLSREKEKRPYYIFNILLFNFIVGGLACLFLNLYPQALGDFSKEPEMTRLAPQIGLVIWLWMFSSFLEIVAIANQEARLATVFIIFAQLTKMVLMVSAVSYFGTVGSMLNAVTVQVIIQTFVLLLYLQYRFKGYWKSYDTGVMSEQLKYALPFGFMGVLWIMQSEAHNFFIMNRFSSEEMGIYAIGCFELPLLGILYESVSSVMIPRMSELQSKGRVREMIELSVRAWEKLSLFYFPVYVVFLITAQTFITTLFTERYITAVPIFLINITLLPSYIFITDPIVRSYEYLGRFILKIRVVIVLLMLGTLWFGKNHLDLTGVIAVVVITAFIERAITLYKIWKFVGFKMEDFALMKNISRIGLVAAFSGLPAIAVYTLIKFQTAGFGKEASMMVFGEVRPHIAEFASGALILTATGIVYAACYIGLLTYFKIISENDRAFAMEKMGFIFRFIGRG